LKAIFPVIQAAITVSPIHLSEMTSRRDGTFSSTLLLVAANLLIPLAILVFATGFFPYKPILPGLATYSTLTDYGEPPAPPFDKLIFMVIDALRR
jgi:ethanolamine phosphate transferase 2 subunit G